MEVATRGGFFFKLLYDNLGWAGAAIGLLAWLIIALDVSNTTG